jgi:tRNA(Ser,Leu) C12 N-acetylase TAN1
MRTIAGGDGNAGSPRKADWNVVVTLSEATFREVHELLSKWGMVRRTPYYKVVAMTVEDPTAFLAAFTAAARDAPGLFNYVAHLAPAQLSFDFDSAEDFEARAREIVLAWAPKLEGKSFYIRLHRRGFKSTLSTHKEERLLGGALLAKLGASGRISFEDPDALIHIETIDGRAGLALWTRDDFSQHPLLAKD